MRVLVACEYSGVVREAFKAKGHYVMSCDLLDTEIPGNHYQGDVRDVLNYSWDLMIAHPPCTFLTSAGARWNYHPEDSDLPFHERRPHPSYPNRRQDQKDALDFVNLLMNANIGKIAIENPIGIISTNIRKPEQVIQPWMFGHGETKATCLWLKNLPPLSPTEIVEGRESRIHMMGESKNRWKERSRTYLGIAQAMADQWG